MNNRTAGVVKWFDAEKGFGFIQCPTLGEEDIFVHYKNIQGEGFRTLKEGQMVDFSVTKTEKGYQADEVRISEPASK